MQRKLNIVYKYNENQRLWLWTRTTIRAEVFITECQQVLCVGMVTGSESIFEPVLQKHGEDSVRCVGTYSVAGFQLCTPKEPLDNDAFV